MKRLLAILLTTTCLLGLVACSPRAKLTKFTDYSFDYFDTATTLVGYAESEAEFDAVCTQIKDLLKEYHQLYDIYHRYDGVNNLCVVNALHDGEHQPVQVDDKLMDLLLYARDLYATTQGKMNVAMGSVLSIWHRYRTAGISDPATAALPRMTELKAAAEHTDIADVMLDETTSTVHLTDPEMLLDVGAIAKGYAVECIALYLEDQGISGYILNVGGNVRCVGGRPDGKAWSVGVENPDTADKENPYIAYLKLEGKSLVTSGSYQRYYTVGGKQYHHIIDPETLMPGTNFRSVSVLCTHSGRADALSTALFTMSYEQGKALVESLNDVEAMWVLPDGEQRFSTGFQAYMYE